MSRDEAYPSTFSIVACDKATNEWGIAVQSRFLAVGSVVPWAKAGVGAIATQARTNTTHGLKGLDLLSRGMPAKAVIEEILRGDEEIDGRQLAVVDSSGNAWAFTGKGATEWAGHVVGDGFSCQGNILSGPEVVSRMASRYQESQGDLAERLLQALVAGQEAGGDRRGKQSAAILVVRDKAGYGGYDRYLDLHVEDHPEPIQELIRLVDLHRVYFAYLHLGKTFPFRGPVAQWITDALVRIGRLEAGGDNETAYEEAMNWATAAELSIPRHGWISGEIVVRLLREARSR